MQCSPLKIPNIEVKSPSRGGQKPRRIQAVCLSRSSSGTNSGDRGISLGPSMQITGLQRVRKRLRERETDTLTVKKRSRNKTCCGWKWGIMCYLTWFDQSCSIHKVDDDSIILPPQQKQFRGDVVSFFGIMFDHFSFFVDSRDRLDTWGDREGRHARKVTAVIEPGTLRLHGIHLIPPGYNRTVMCRAL